MTFDDEVEAIRTSYSLIAAAAALIDQQVRFALELRPEPRGPWYLTSPAYDDIPEAIDHLQELWHSRPAGSAVRLVCIVTVADSEKIIEEIRGEC